MELGVTGSRSGLNADQYKNFAEWLAGQSVETFRQGDCVGVDLQVSELIRIWYPKAYIISHPPEKSALRAYFEADKVMPTKSYFARNRDIVNNSELLIGFPAHRSKGSGGSWYTINYAIRQGVTTVIFHSDGEIELT